MSRLERPEVKGSNPAMKFLEYKSEAKQFSYYDKERKVNVAVDAPIKFCFLEHYHTVKGWHDPTQKGIYSNEVYALSTEKLTVKTFGGLELAEGFYKDLKDKVKLSGGVYHRSVYVMLEDGTIANLQLKGTVVGGISKENSLSKLDIDGYSEFYKKNQHLLDSNWFCVKRFEDAKKGATKFSIPVFEIAENLTPDDNAQADKCASILQEFVNNRAGAKAVEIEVVEPVILDDLDF